MTRTTFAGLGVVACCAALAGCGASHVSAPSTTAPTVTVPASTSAPPPASTATQPLPASLADLVAKVRSGVLRIEVTACDYSGLGTGFLLGPRLVATVEHVVDGAVSITLKRNGSVVGSATVIGEDPARDLALLRTDLPIAGYQFKLAARAPRLGEEVAALGFPLGLPLSVTKGTVSGSDRTIPIGGLERRQLVQTDAAVNPGNSGGPLISTANGDVVGLIDLGADQANGLAFAVSAQVAGPLLQAWRVAPQPIGSAACEGQSPPPVAAPPPQQPPPPATSSAEAQAAEAAIAAHWRLINEQDYNAAYDSFSPRLQAKFTRAGWVEDKLRDRPVSSPVRFRGGATVSGNEADVSVAFRTVGSETSSTNTGCNDWTGSYHMVKIGALWRIDATHLSRSSC